MKLNSEQSNYYHACLADILETKEAQSMKQYIQHGSITTYMHCIRVSYYSYYLSQRFHVNVNTKSLIRGAFLHDFYLYDWHDPTSHRPWHGFHHPKTAYEKARQLFTLNSIETNIILSHMWPLTITSIPTCKEAVIVCIIDKICSLQETFQN